MHMTKLIIGYCMKSYYIKMYLFYRYNTSLLVFSPRDVYTWGNSCPGKFNVTNCVKQGDILSPTLFHVYMNNLSVLLSQSGIGGFFGDDLINHIIMLC